MGGRGRKEEPQDRSSWIQEVSNSRLLAYDRMLSSGGSGHRADGAERLERQRSYLQGEVRREKARRGL